MKRNIIILAVVFVVALVVVLLIRSTEEKRLSTEDIRDFFWADSNLIDSIAVKYGTWNHLFLDRQGKWQMVVDSALIYPASELDVVQAIRTTNEMVLTDLISINPANQERFNTDTIKGTVIEFYDDSQPLSRFVLGQTGQDLTHTYVRRIGSDSVFLAKGKFARIFTKPPSNWMDREAIPWDAGQISEIHWQYPTSEVRLARREDHAYEVAQDPTFDWTAADSAKAAQKFTAVANFYYSGFLPGEREDEANFDEIMLTMTVTDTGGNQQSLIFASDTTAQARLHVRAQDRKRPIGISFSNNYDRITGTLADLLPQPDTTEN